MLRSHGRPRWDTPLAETTGTEPSRLTVGDLSIRVQLVPAAGHPWPTEVREIEQRYADVPGARLRTFTSTAFAAAKLAAWVDRSLSRDLWDTVHLARAGHVGADAARLYLRLGQFAHRPGSWVFGTPPPEARWVEDLAHQTRLSLTAAEASSEAAAAWARAFAAAGDR